MIKKRWILFQTQASAYLWQLRYTILRMVWNRVIYPVYWGTFSLIEKISAGNPNRQVDFPVTPLEKEYPMLMLLVEEDRYDGINRTPR